MAISAGAVMSCIPSAVRLPGRAALSLLALCAALACGNDEQARRDCDEIASRCHSYGKESEVAARCHDLGHQGSKAPQMCTSKKAECLAACPIMPVRYDAGVDLGTGDAAASDGGGSEDAPAQEVAVAPVDAPTVPAEVVQVCTTYCACMATTCMNKLANPALATPAACLETCTKYQPAERKCWANFCQQAAQGMSTGHNCDHASGELGLDECE
jgi:hypothetical protein